MTFHPAKLVTSLGSSLAYISAGHTLARGDYLLVGPLILLATVLSGINTQLNLGNYVLISLCGVGTRVPHGGGRVPIVIRNRVGCWAGRNPEPSRDGDNGGIPTSNGIPESENTFVKACSAGSVDPPICKPKIGGNACSRNSNGPYRYIPATLIACIIRFIYIAASASAAVNNSNPLNLFNNSDSLFRPSTNASYCSIVSLRHAESRSISATRPRASAASFSSLAARTVASASAFSASATLLSSADLARFAKRNSPQTPRKISALAATDRAFSGQVFPRMNTAAISTASPARISNASRSAQTEKKSDVDFGSLVFGPNIANIIRPRGKRSDWTVRLWVIGAICAVLALLYIVVAHLLGWSL